MSFLLLSKNVSQIYGFMNFYKIIPQKLFFIFYLLLISKESLAKNDSLVNPQIRSSPTMIANLISIENKYVKLTYGQPFRKNRLVFGGIVPFDQIWRTGANEATEITINTNFILENRRFNAGTYTLFTVPSERTWRIIINQKLGQWGAFDYNKKDDLLEFEVIPLKTSELYEALFISLSENKKDEINLKLSWENTNISFNFTLVKPLAIENSLKRKKRWFKGK